jgi:hypothetical protein
MSEQSLQIARRHVELWNGPDLDDIEKVWAPDAILYGWDDWPESGNGSVERP